MAYDIKKTEHAGAEHGNGAYWRRKWIAKKGSNKIRRHAGRQKLKYDNASDAI